VCENGVLRRIFGPRRERENCIMRSSIICTLPPDIIRMIKSKEDEMSSAYNAHG
jgi:hypothetical protein